MDELTLLNTDQKNEMINHISSELFGIIDTHFYEDSFNRIVRDFVHYKQSESTIWPDLTLYTYRMLGGLSPAIYHAAAQTELIILSLDIFDDLQDQDHFNPPWMQCEHATAMNCASNILVAGISGNSDRSIDAKILKQLSTAHNGQHTDIQNMVAHEEAYLKLIGEKSGALINLAIHMGYQLIENKDPSIEKRLDEFAQHIGIAAQLQNDVKALTNIQTRNDIIQRKMTLTTMFLLDQCTTAFPLLREYYDGACEVEDLISQKTKLVDFIHSSGVVAYTSVIQKLYLNQAEKVLQTIPTLHPWDTRFKEITIDQFL